eukprot:PhM_4_TR14714/c1_g1_i1/m.7540
MSSSSCLRVSRVFGSYTPPGSSDPSHYIVLPSDPPSQQQQQHAFVDAPEMEKTREGRALISDFTRFAGFGSAAQIPSDDSVKMRYFEDHVMVPECRDAMVQIVGLVRDPDDARKMCVVVRGGRAVQMLEEKIALQQQAETVGKRKGKRSRHTLDAEPTEGEDGVAKPPNVLIGVDTFRSAFGQELLLAFLLKRAVWVS